MPYTSVPMAGEDRFEIAERRWRALAESRPDLSPAIQLQRRLLTIVADLARTLEDGSAPRLSPAPEYVAGKLARGLPVLAGEAIPVPVAILRPPLLQLCATLAHGGAGESATHIEEALAKGEIDAGSLLAACLARNQTAVRAGAIHHGLAPDLVWLVAELAAGPFVHMLQRTLLADATGDVLPPALQAWDRGYCPACGSWPALAEVSGGHRTLRCSFCAGGWELTAYACVYCAESGEAFVTAAPDAARKDRRVEVCSRCGGYLKTIDLPELSPYPLLSISDLETTDLDVAAMEHGYVRPMLKEFEVKELRTCTGLRVEG
jgi:FdhE protein